MGDERRSPERTPLAALADDYARLDAERTEVRILGKILGVALLGGVVTLIAGLSFDAEPLLLVAAGFGVLIALCGVGIFLLALVSVFARDPANRGYFALAALGGAASVIVGLFTALLGAIVGSGGIGIAPWGRPLRIRGKMIHPDLVPGAAWAQGPAPRVDDLSPETRAALACLWHHDAQKEHASVPAFSRIAWVLAGLGAPAELLEDVHRCGVQEIDHARRCFALAGGYAGATLEASAMPELLRADLGLGGDPLRALAVESLSDGCLIEDFNADVAEVAHAQARDPAARELAGIIARDEREHAAVAWKIVAWCVDVGGDPIREALAAAIAGLPTRGPVAFGPDDAPLVSAADPQALVEHGRVPADRWAPIFERRRALTCERAYALIGRPGRRAA